MGRRAEYQQRIEEFARSVLLSEGALPQPARLSHELGVSLSTAYRYLDKVALAEGAERPRLIARTSASDREKFIREIEKGSSVAETARRFKVGENTVRRAMEEAQVTAVKTTRRRSTPRPKRQGPTLRDRVLKYVQDRAGMGESPSQREIAEALGVSTGVVSYHLSALESEGLILNSGGGQMGPTLRGSRFIGHCTSLAQAAAKDDAIPASQRALVLSMCMPALAPKPQIKSPYLDVAIPAAIEFNACRQGRPATERDVRETFPSANPRALRDALRRGVSNGTLRKETLGFVKVGPDPMYAAAAVLHTMPTTGWRSDLLQSRTFVLRVILGL